LYTVSTSIFCAGGGYGFEVRVLAREGFIGKEETDVTLAEAGADVILAEAGIGKERVVWF
jgi:hypothetical protein